MRTRLGRGAIASPSEPLSAHRAPHPLDLGLGRCEGPGELDLADVANVRSADLPYGKQRRLEIARAMATQPELLLLDEPAAGMNPNEKEDLAATVRLIRDKFNKTVLLIEHDMKVIMSLCQYIYAMATGEIIAQGLPEEIREKTALFRLLVIGLLAWGVNAAGGLWLAHQRHRIGAHMLWGGAIVVQGFLLLALISLIT